MYVHAVSESREWELQVTSDLHKHIHVHVHVNTKLYYIFIIQRMTVEYGSGYDSGY